MQLPYSTLIWKVKRLFYGPLTSSLLRRAQRRIIVVLYAYGYRETWGNHTVDDTQYTVAIDTVQYSTRCRKCCY
jgi:hypothetical protein